MRGRDERPRGEVHQFTLESRVPGSHPLRRLRMAVNVVLKSLDADFDAIYKAGGRPSIPPEHLLRAMLLQVLYSVRSERQMVEQLDYNLLFRWFVGLDAGGPTWDHSTFSANRARLLSGEIAAKFFYRVKQLAIMAELCSDEHFTVDGTLIEAWASIKSFRRKDGSDDPPPPGRNPSVDFHGEPLGNDTHESSTDGDAKLYRKGKVAAKPYLMGHVLIENRNGLVLEVAVTQANGHAERAAALVMADRHGVKAGATLGGDKGFDTADFIADLQERQIEPHIARNESNRESAVPKSVSSSPGYEISQRRRKIVEEVFGWAKTVGGMRKSRFVGVALTRVQALLVFATYNLVRMRSLCGWNSWNARGASPA